MRIQNVISVLVMSLVALSASLAFAGRDGGGGFQYPNSRALLKKVSSELANEILQMDKKAFANFPREFTRDEIACLIRQVMYRPDLEKPGTNADGEEEGLMFDYTDSFCRGAGCCASGKALVALLPFFDTYRALPMKQLAEKNFTPDFYKLTEKDIRQRLLHEVAHLVGVGIGKSDDANGDVFADRVLTARYGQYVRCEVSEWQKSLTDIGGLLWYGLLLHRSSGQMAVIMDNYSPSTTGWDQATQKEIPYPVPDIHKSPVYVSNYLDQMEKNGPWRNEAPFNANPLPTLHGVVQPSYYKATDADLAWSSSAFHIFQEDKSVGQLIVNLEAGTGSFELPSGVADENGHRLVPGLVKVIRFPMSCRAISPEIEIKDIQ